MEKGFNDDELADIMNEIESLEQEFTDSVEMSQSKDQEVASLEDQEQPEAISEDMSDDAPTQADEESSETIEAQQEEYFEPETTLNQEHIDDSPIEEEPIVEAVSEEVEEEPIVEAVSEEVEEEPIVEAVSEEIEEEPMVEALSEEVVSEYDFDENDTSFDHTEQEPIETENAFTEEGMSQILEDLTQMPVETITNSHESIEDEYDNVHHLRAVTEKDNPVNPTSKPNNEKKSKSAMSFKVAGDMTIDLSFEVAEQEISISVNEDNGLVINLANGATFSLPLNTNAVKKVG